MMSPSHTSPGIPRWVSTVAVCALLFAKSAGAWVIADTPPFVPTPLPPNIFITLDDSGSMRSAYVPEGIGSVWFSKLRRVKSADFNAIYYNPRTVYKAPVLADGTVLTTNFTAALIHGFNASKGVVDLSTGYRVTWEYDPSRVEIRMLADNPSVDFFPSSDKPDLTNAPVPAYYYTYDPVKMNATCPAPSINEDGCYALNFVSNVSGPGVADLNGDGKINGLDKDERQNFANWYSFYRTRNLSTISAATLVFQKLPKDARVAWQSINSCRIAGTACYGYDGRRDKNGGIRSWAVGPDGTADTTHRDNFYRWLTHLPASGGTPLRAVTAEVGEYFSRRGDNNPYKLYPNQGFTSVNQGPEYACRPNFHIIMTDGIWNVNSGFCGVKACGNEDNPAQTLVLPDGTPYRSTSGTSGIADLTQVYRDSNSDSLSDISFYLWATDLRPDLPNKLIPYYKNRQGTQTDKYWNPENDPATWQHLVTFTVGLGMRATMNLPGLQWEGGTYEGTGYSNLLNGRQTWPETGSDYSPGNVYDLWHAAINGRGMAFAAESPMDLIAALSQALYRISDNKTAAAALAANSTRLANESTIFQARFNTVDWSGTLTASRISSDATRGAEIWDATDAGKIPAWDQRKIYTWDGTANRKGIEFVAGDLKKAGLWTDGYDDDVLAFLRGDTSKDGKTVVTGSNGKEQTRTFRIRGTRLGDIVNSDPVFVGSQDYGYASLPEGRAGVYDAFVKSKDARTKMLYVGANDGMLHAFNASTGVELFSYVPRAVVGTMPLLADPTYTHKYFVDGSPSVWDAYVGNIWRSVLVGTTGAGGKSIFALDISSPDNFSKENVLWEINSQTERRSGDSGDPGYGTDLGFTLGQAVVAKLNNGEWAAVFGNGYGSAGQRAVLYIVRISDGTLIRKIDTGVGGADVSNGLGRPTLYDSNGDDVYDYAYAADLQGNVWKFDLSTGASSDQGQSSWKVAFEGAPLFRARNAAGEVQSIQGRLELARPPEGIAGVMVLFGTGRFFTSSDQTDLRVQSFYSVLDAGEASGPISVSNRSTLRKLSISTFTGDAVGQGESVSLRRVTPESSTPPQPWQGWYMDLVESDGVPSGERVIGTPIVRGGRVIFTTMIPTSDLCDFGGGGWLMEVDAKSGSQFEYPVFDTNRDSSISSSDLSAAGVKIGVGLVKQPLVLEGSPSAAKIMSGTTGEIQVERNLSFGAGLGRNSWRDLRK